MRDIDRIKTLLQIDHANCLTCKYHSNECGYDQCLDNQPKANLKSFPFNKEQQCWAPYFWNSVLILDLNRNKYWNDAVYYEFVKITHSSICSSSAYIDVEQYYKNMPILSKIFHNFYLFSKKLKR